MTRGRFIVLEGGEASGKSTQVQRLASRLRESGHEVVETFEPGATAVGARVRALLLDGPETIEPVAEAFLLAADRGQHVGEIVGPALERGADVVSDRYVASSLVYQGVARGLGVGVVEDLNRVATGGLEPDVVIVLDVSDEVAVTRRPVAADRMEREGGEFHAAVRDAYRKLAADRGWVLIDADADIDAVAEQVWAVVEQRLRQRRS
jgi:dTMP kinase